MGEYDGTIQTAMLVRNEQSVVFFSNARQFSSVADIIRGEVTEERLTMYFVYTSNDNPMPVWVCQPPSFVVVRCTNEYCSTIDIFQQDALWAPIPVFRKTLSETLPSSINNSLRDLLCINNQDMVRRRGAKIAKVMDDTQWTMILSQPYMNASHFPLPFEWECYFVYDRRDYPNYMVNREFAWMIRSSQLSIQFERRLETANRRPTTELDIETALSDLHIQSTNSLPGRRQHTFHRITYRTNNTWRFHIGFRNT